MTETELLPCPFCGGDVELRSWDWPYERYQVRCSQCKAHARARMAKKSEAITAWNTRAIAPDEVTGEAGALAKDFRELVNFLRGKRALDGVFFGDAHPQHRGNFWWQSKFLSPISARIDAYLTKQASNEGDAPDCEYCEGTGEILCRAIHGNRPVPCECTNPEGKAKPATDNTALVEAFQELTDEADKLNGIIDLQTYDCKIRMEDWTDDFEFDVSITAKQERDFNNAICAAQKSLAALKEKAS